ncbi:hypothetical protein ACVMK5_03805, partial [Klebsiella pneumoniae]
GEYNRTDGGFLSSKIITEFGVMGLMASLLYILLILRSVTNYRQSDTQYIIKISSAAMIAFSVEFFLRGYGYFSPSVILLMALALCSIRMKKNSI